MKSLFSRYKGGIKNNILLAAVWGAVIVTGLLALGAVAGGIEGLIVFAGIHSLVVRLSFVYTAIHVFQHRKQIMLRFRVKIGSSKHAENKRQKSSCAIKGISAIAFHILLHMVSVHLAVGYTLYHIAQHRHGVVSIFKKLSFRNNAALNRSLQSAQLTQSAQVVPLPA